MQSNSTSETYLLTKFREYFGSPSSDDDYGEKSRSEIELSFLNAEHEDLELRVSGKKNSSRGVSSLAHVFDVAIDVDTATTTSTK